MTNTIKLSTHIKWYSGSKKIKLAPDPNDNIFNLDGFDYMMRYLDSIEGSKGGNSNVFLLIDPNEPDNEDSHFVVKICNRPIEKSDPKYRRRYQRELIALRRAKKASKNNIIKYYHRGVFVINNLHFPFYTMERAHYDLSQYIQNHMLEIDQKLLLCLSIIKGFKELHDLDVYHRDIKHDNIFIIGNECKVGDLGLIKFRRDDVEFIRSELGDRIGAFGWESPETMNKYLTENNDQLSFDCDIDSLSDIFQLGKLFWFIFQGNLPVGQIVLADFLEEDEDIFYLIFQMLQYSKQRRIQSITDVERHLSPIAKRYCVY